MKKKVLSKSKLMLGLQCPKRLWLTLNEPSLLTPVDASTQRQFDEGQKVGELAREHFGEGVLIDCDYYDYSSALKRTQEAIEGGIKTIYEGAFSWDSFFARIDILHRDRAGWHLIEVKKSTSAKDYHLDDAGIQTIILQENGFKIKSVSIMHLNTDCRYPDLTDLFKQTDITNEVFSMKESLLKKLKKLSNVPAKKICPTIPIGPHCSVPFECDFREHCWKHIPEQSVFDLPGLGSVKKWQYIEDGKVSINDLDPKSFKNKTKQAIECVQQDSIFVDSKIIREELQGWIWPLNFFDFETIMPAIPRYQGVKPYGGIPFQYSCHIWKNKNSKKLIHQEFLHTKTSDPRGPIIKSLLACLEEGGSIVAYNMSFEKGVIKSLAEFAPNHRKALLSLIDRFVDPLPLIRKAVYHPEFKGSFSIKAVGPALLGSKFSYADMEIGDGGEALSWGDLLLKGELKGTEKDRVVKLLLEYCKQDTLIMVELVKWLYKESGR